jgi:shikimate kinase
LAACSPPAWLAPGISTPASKSAPAGIPAIFEHIGEPAFRAIETTRLDTLMVKPSIARPLILALGGGTYAQPGTAEKLRAAGALSLAGLPC